MSESNYLYGAAVQGIQNFIFQTNKLREIVGASELVEEICTSKFYEILTGNKDVLDVQDKLKADKNAILHAAGNIKYIFDDKSDCEKMVREFPKAIFEFAPGVTVSQAVVEMAGDNIDFEKAVNELEKKLCTQRNRPMRSATLGLMGIERSRQTGLPVTFVKKETRFGKTEEIHVDEGSRAKLYEDPSGERLKTTKKLCVKAFGEELNLKDNDDRIAYNIEDITRNNDWIAIIHADGNGLGQVVQKVGYDQENFKRFSEKLDEATTSSARAAYEAVKEQFNNPEEKADFIPIRPIVLGGDDLTVVCRADIALDYVTAFIDYFEKETTFIKGLRSDKLQLNNLTACAGIAYIKSSFPFYYGYELAEALCAQAKKDAKADLKDGELAKSCLMFHKVQDSFTEEWTAIAKRELTPQENISFQFGPYYLKTKDNRMTIENLKEYAEKLEINEGNVVKSHMRQWMSMLHDNPEMAYQKLERLKSMTSMKDFVDDITRGTKRKFSDKIFTTYPVYDILAIHTINNQMTKEVEQ